jgi:hypothetical protein
VADVALLKRMGVRARLIWPEGHGFQRTEIMSAAMRAELGRLGALRRQFERRPPRVPPA